MDQDVLRLAQVLAVVGLFGGFMVLVIFAAIYGLKRAPRSLFRRDTVIPGIDEARFARLEQAVDAIAVEVERITEGQRFTTKLMAERAQEKLPLPAAGEKNSV